MIHRDPIRLAAGLFGVDEHWRRPVSRRRTLRNDVLVAVAFAVGGVLSLEAARSVGALTTVELGGGWELVWVLVPAATLAVRRLLPLATLAVCCLHLAFTAWLAADLSAVFAIQFYYYFVLFTAIAWSRHRRAAMAMTALFGAVALVWVVVEVAVRDTLAAFELRSDVGAFSPTAGAVVQLLLTNAVVYASTIGAGTTTWWSARREARTREQALTVVDQSEQLSDRAVGTERVRIARELHDVVGHHVAVIGIQTAAARRTFEVAPERATTAMLQAEETARSASRDLRLLLSALRERDEAHDGSGPQAGLSSLLETVESFEKLGLAIDLRSAGDLGAVPMAVGLALHRILQESLTNVSRHSTADRVEVVLTVRPTGNASGTVSLRVTDNGSPKGNTSGSQVGVVGMRERALLHGGALRTSTTADGGFEVVADLEWSDA